MKMLFLTRATAVIIYFFIIVLSLSHTGVWGHMLPFEDYSFPGDPCAPNIYCVGVVLVKRWRCENKDDNLGLGKLSAVGVCLGLSF